MKYRQFFSFVVISIECFEKLRHNQKIFPLKNIKGFKCIYNELERKGSLPYIEQKRAASSSPQTRKVNPPTTLITRSNTKTSPTNSPPANHRTVDQQKSVISYSLRQTDDRQTSPNRQPPETALAARLPPGPFAGRRTEVACAAIPAAR